MPKPIEGQGADPKVTLEGQGATPPPTSTENQKPSPPEKEPDWKAIAEKEKQRADSTAGKLKKINDENELKAQKELEAKQEYKTLWEQKQEEVGNLTKEVETFREEKKVRLEKVEQRNLLEVENIQKSLATEDQKTAFNSWLDAINSLDPEAKAEALNNQSKLLSINLVQGNSAGLPLGNKTKQPQVNKLRKLKEERAKKTQEKFKGILKIQ